MNETINLKHELQFPGMPELPYRVVYNGNSLMSICSDTDKVVVAYPPEIPEGRHTYFQADERESKGMQFMVYAANRHHALTDALRQKEAENANLRLKMERALTILDNLFGGGCGCGQCKAVRPAISLLMEK